MGYFLDFTDSIKDIDGLFPSDENWYAIRLEDVEVIETSHKALHIQCDNFIQTVWVPKSQLRVDADSNLRISSFMFNKLGSAR